MNREIQIRHEDGSLGYFTSLDEAFDFADNDQTAWKISWSWSGGRHRLVRDAGGLWREESLLKKMEPHKYEPTTNPYLGCARCSYGPGSIRHNLEAIEKEQ